MKIQTTDARETANDLADQLQTSPRGPNLDASTTRTCRREKNLTQPPPPPPVVFLRAHVEGLSGTELDPLNGDYVLIKDEFGTYYAGSPAEAWIDKDVTYWRLQLADQVTAYGPPVSNDPTGTYTAEDFPEATFEVSR